MASGGKTCWSQSHSLFLRSCETLLGQTPVISLAALDSPPPFFFYSRRARYEAPSSRFHINSDASIHSRWVSEISELISEEPCSCARETKKKRKRKNKTGARGMCRVKRVGGATFFTVRSPWQYVQWLGSLFAQGSENQLAFVPAWISSCVILFFFFFSCAPF